VSLSLSPQLRLIALFGVLAVMIALGGMFFVMRGALLSGEIEQVPPVVHRPQAARTKPAKATPVEPKPKLEAAPKVVTPKVTAPKVTTPRVTAPKVTAPKVTAPKVTTPKETAPKPSTTIETPGVAPNGLPTVIAQALRKQPVVVVALVVPGGELDEMTVAEAKAGAKAAGVGFLTVNILKNSVGRPLAQKLGVIQTPSLVVFRRPATVFVRFQGFTDRDTVIQAAASARTAR
jgi:hypothetical protein